MANHGPGLSTSRCSHQWPCSHQRPPRLTSTSTLYLVLSFRAQFLIASKSYPSSCVALAVKFQHVWSCLGVKNPLVATLTSAPFSLVRVKLCKIHASVAGPIVRIGIDSQKLNRFQFGSISFEHSRTNRQSMEANWNWTIHRFDLLWTELNYTHNRKTW